MKNSCYGEIFETAIRELGRGSEREGFRRLTRLLVQSRDVEWMYQFWVRVHGSRMLHLPLRFRCEIWRRLAWGMLKHSRIFDMRIVELNRATLAKNILADLDSPFSPSNLFDDGELSLKLRNKLKSVAA